MATENGGMTDIRLSDAEWSKIRDFLRHESRAHVGQDDQSCRRFVEAVKWISRSGAQWRLLPAEYGAWNTVYKRFVRWCEAGVWERLLAALATDPDTEHSLLDATIVRAHPCAAGAQKNTERKRSGAAAAGTVAKFTSPWMA
jgi:transposase